MSFGMEVRQWTLKVQRTERDVFVRTAQLTHSSIVEGSAVTGAPGQPVDTGMLKGSWQLSLEELVATIVTNVIYGPNVEFNISRWGRPMTLRSAVGGWHSVALTRAGFPRLVDQAVAEVGRA